MEVVCRLIVLCVHRPAVFQHRTNQLLCKSLTHACAHTLVATFARQKAGIFASPAFVLQVCCLHCLPEYAVKCAWVCIFLVWQHRCSVCVCVCACTRAVCVCLCVGESKR